MTQYVINFSKPPGMTVKEFKQTVLLIEKKRPLLSYAEKQQCQELLKSAGIKKELMGNSLNFNVAELIKDGIADITPAGIEMTELHMKINALPIFLKLVLHDELYLLSMREVEKNDKFIRSKGYMDCEDDSFWQKKIWITSENYRVILISKGVGNETNMFYRIEAFFKKDAEMPYEEKTPVYSQYLKDLVI